MSILLRSPRLSSEDKETIIIFLAANGKCQNPNPQLGNIHEYSLRVENEQLTLETGQVVDARKISYISV